MTNDMTKRKQELSGDYINESIPHTLRDEPAWHYSVIDFEKGFDAGVAEMQAQVDELKKALEYQMDRYAELDTKPSDFQIIEHQGDMIDSLKAQVEIALKAMETVHDNVIFEALDQIQKMRGVPQSLKD